MSANPFYIPEVLEAILANLDTAGFLRISRLNSQLHSTISNLYLHPQSPRLPTSFNPGLRTDLERIRLHKILTNPGFHPVIRDTGEAFILAEEVEVYELEPGFISVDSLDENQESELFTVLDPEGTEDYLMN